METTQNTKPVWRMVLAFMGSRLFLMILSGILVTFLVYAMIMLMLATHTARTNLTSMEGLKTLKSEEVALLQDEEGRGLLMKKAFISSRIERTKDDSTGISIDLSNNSIALDVKGVTLFERTFEDLSVSPFFKSLPDTFLLKLASEPLVAGSFRSTIVREPIIEKKAPKDTSEVDLTDFSIDTSYREPAFLVIRLENQIELVLKQYHGVSFRDQFKYGSFIFRERFGRIGEILHALIRGRVPSYTPRIVMELSAKDIRIIYRALPRHPRISLKIV